MRTIEIGKVIDVPAEVAKCPYCEQALYCQPTAWTEDDDGNWFATESGLECDGQPEDPLSDAWGEWLQTHTVMPYVHWLPVDQKVLDWLKRNYRFLMDP